MSSRVKIADICTKICSGGTPKSGVAEYYENGKIPWLNTGEINFNRIRHTNSYITEAGLANSSAKWISKNSISIAMYGATAGKAAIVKIPLTTNQACCNLEVNESAADYRFVYYWLQYNYSKLANLANGGAQQNLSAKTIKALEIDLPPMPVQRSVAEVLSRLDDKVELNNRLNDYLAKLLDALFTKALEDVDGWEEATLLDIANYKNGLAMQKFRPEGNDPGLPVLKIKELGQGSCESDAERCRSDIDESVRIYDGDLVFSWSGTLLLDFWAGGDAGLNQHLFKVTSERYPSWFVYMWTKYHMRKFIALAKDRATTMGHIKRSALAEAEVLIPPADVLGKLTEQMQPVVDQMIGLKVEARKLGELRDVLLPKLMSGEIDVSKVDLTPLNNHLCAG
ncbi:restriction endonuclease subunit S [Collinsella sp. LCP21S3_A9]|uniref:restriction endonuclease subunit S n=1 Tax=Collinsella sp. LCP21S3_A9 TaxID=3438770 RepID=UPI003F8EDAA7